MKFEDIPQPGALISLNQARDESRCRICGEPIKMTDGRPVGWKDEFRAQLFPVAIVLNYGEEFAHPQCLKEENT